jgi:hypothetical protein
VLSKVQTPPSLDYIVLKLTKALWKFPLSASTSDFMIHYSHYILYWVLFWSLFIEKFFAGILQVICLIRGAVITGRCQMFPEWCQMFPKRWCRMIPERCQEMLPERCWMFPECIRQQQPQPFGRRLLLFILTARVLTIQDSRSQDCSGTFWCWCCWWFWFRWTHVRYIPGTCHPIGHTWGIFPAPTTPLVTREVYSQHLPPHWSHVRYIPSTCHPIGRPTAPNC